MKQQRYWKPHWKTRLTGLPCQQPSEAMLSQHGHIYGKMDIGQFHQNHLRYKVMLILALVFNITAYEFHKQLERLLNWDYIFYLLLSLQELILYYLVADFSRGRFWRLAGSIGMILCINDIVDLFRAPRNETVWEYAFLILAITITTIYIYKNAG